MYGAILDIFNMHVQRPRTTKFHPNRINPAQLWRHADSQDGGPDVAIRLSIAFLTTSLNFKKVEIYLLAKFRWHFSIHGSDIATSGFWKQTSAMLALYFRFRFPSWHHHRHNTLHQPTKFYANRTTHSRVMTSLRFLDDGNVIAILLPVSFWMISLTYEGRSIAADQILARYLNPRLRYY